MNKVVGIDQAIEKVYDGDSMFLGGFLGVGSPLKCIEKLAASGKKELTIISEVSGMPGGGFDMAVLFKNRQVKKSLPRTSAPARNY